MAFADFADDECTCSHDAAEHDDGFGCTEPDCPCLAQWFIQPDDYEPEGIRL